MYAQEIARLKSKFHLHMQGGNFLDIGCGTGDWYAHLHGDKYLRYGVEPDEYAAEQARLKGVFIGGYDYAPGSFDVVIFRGTIQHIENPFDTLRKANELLRSGGLLVFLATPNTNSPMYKRIGTLPALDPPRNWWIPSDITLENVLINMDFENIEFYYPYGKPYARPLHDFVCYLLGKPAAFPRSMMECYAIKR
jgi:SAM-dependent methyltransferase